MVVQIYEEAVKFGKSSGIRTVVVYGGAERHRQVYELSQGVDLIVATPGRLIDLMKAGVTNMERVTFFVLDEADRMLDMGFGEQIQSIASQIRKDRQTLMWSATWPPEVKSLARQLCKLEPCFILLWDLHSSSSSDPIKLQIGSQDLALNDKIKQRIDFVSDDEKIFQ